MGLDPRYIPINSLQEYFVDKDSGFPLAAGKIYFWEDQARTIPKPVYQITGSPPNYTYSVLPNPVILSSVGTFADDSGNDIMGYYFPYDISGNLELYYVTVYSAGDVFQFSREGQPNLASTSTVNDVSLLNYIPNGQFLEHIDLPNSGLIPVSGTDYAIPIAYGNWLFSSTANSTAVNHLTFTRINSPTDNPSSSPRYTAHVVCTIPDATDLYKKIEVRFPDVNKFASDTQQYTLSFTAKSNTGSFNNVDFVVRKYFGVGGSPDVSTDIDTVTITNSYKTFNIPFTFGTNNSYVIGANNDDYVSLEIHFAVNFVLDLELTDFVLTPNDVTVTQFPQTPQAQFTYEGIFGSLPVPAFDGSDLYLPLVLTPAGVVFDRGVVGKIYAGMYDTANVGELLCDGSSYDPTAYSTNGIPYSRLFNVIYNPGFGGGMFGTGYGNLTGYRYGPGGSTPSFLLWNNSPGLTTAASDGTIPTGFTFMEVYTGGTQHFNSYYGAYDGFVYVQNIANGAPLHEPAAGTTTFTFIKVREGNSNIKALYSIGNIIEANFIAGSYFLISSVTTDYYVWFKKNGVGSDPAVAGRTGIMINMPTGADMLVYNLAISNALKGVAASYITAVAGSAIAAGSYFNAYNAAGSHYYMWMQKDGLGSDPNVPGAIGIKVGIHSADIDIQIANISVVSINGKYFAVPDLRGMFLRMKSGASGVDPDANYRISISNGEPGGNNIGTIEDFEVQSHEHFSVRDIGTGHDSYGTSHSDAYSGGGGGGWGNGNLYPDSKNAAHTDWTGGHETRPTNVYVNYFIKY
jgi:hypothetical protein